jgi:predicted ATPase/class 3 adenylate cyclase
VADTGRGRNSPGMAEQPTGTVTLLFTDIEGSTRLLERVGRERYGEALELHRRLLREAFARHGGFEVDCEGDAFFVAFAAAEDAVTAASEAQQALAAAEWQEGNEIRVRIGIHTGEPLAVPPKYVGLDVHEAARIMAAGHGGQVLVSAATERLVATEFELLSLGEHRLKDLLQPVPLYQLQINGLPWEFPALKTLGNRPTNLPVQPNALIGRERELLELAGLLRDDKIRLVTLTGPGGTGKTRLALQLAADVLDDFGSGVFFVSLAPIHDPELVIPAVAQTLAVREAAGETLIETLQSYLEQKAMLLLLDNFEQVIEAAPSLSKLMANAPRLKLLVTSRERLRLAGERVREVPPLEIADPAATTDLFALAQSEAVALFLARAQALQADFTLTPENAPAIVAICTRVDGLPLAIELAASRIPVLPPLALQERLEQRLQVLTGGARDADERQRTLRKTIEWSYDLLDERERILFLRLGVFVGGCRLDAAETVCSPDGGLAMDVPEGVFSLVEKSLLRQRQDRDGEPRYWMLETIREYACERLADLDDADDLHLGHAKYMLMLAESAAAKRREREPDWDGALEREEDNARAALAWLGGSERTDLLLRLAASMGVFWNVHANLREGRRWLDEALACSGGEPTEVRARALAIAGRMAWRQGDLERAREFVEESLTIAQRLQHTAATAEALWVLGVIAYIEGDYGRARALCEEAAGHYADLGAMRDQAAVLHDLALFATEQHDYVRAQELFQGSLVPLQEIRDEVGITRALGGLGLVALLESRYGDALSFLREGLRREREQGEMEIGIANSLTGIAACLVQLGRPEAGLRVAGAADAFLEQTGAVQVERYMQEILDRALRHARTEIGNEALTEAWNAGRKLTLEAASTYALEVAAKTAA